MFSNALISYHRGLVTNTYGRKVIIKVNNTEQNRDVMFTVRYQRFVCFEVELTLQLTYRFDILSVQRPLFCEPLCYRNPFLLV